MERPALACSDCATAEMPTMLVPARSATVGRGFKADKTAGLAVLSFPWSRKVDLVVDVVELVDVVEELVVFEVEEETVVEVVELVVLAVVDVALVVVVVVVGMVVVEVD